MRSTSALLLWIPGGLDCWLRIFLNSAYPRTGALAGFGEVKRNRDLGYINEAIIDVAVDAAKFRGAYQGGMPTLGCPGCNGETMKYVDQEPKAAHRALCARGDMQKSPI